jgi:hypothetical protein
MPWTQALKDLEGEPISYEPDIVGDFPEKKYFQLRNDYS